MRAMPFASEMIERSPARKRRWFGRAEAASSIEIFNPSGADVLWIRRAFGGLKFDRDQIHTVDAAMMLDLMLAHGVSVHTDPFEPGMRSPRIIERFYSQRFSATTRDAFEPAFEGVDRPMRGIVCLHNVTEDRMLNFVHRPGEGIWYLDVKANRAWSATAHEINRVFDRYHPAMGWLLTNRP